MAASEYELDGKVYVWTGSRWYDKSDFTTPPSAVIARLNKLIATDLETDDASITDPNELVKRAQLAREHGQLPRAIRLLKRAATARPNHIGTAAVLCSALRQDGRPAEALEATQHFAGSEYQPLLTSRAAALCDLGRWEDANRQIRRVIAISNGRAQEEALNVRKRIQQNAPELFD